MTGREWNGGGDARRHCRTRGIGPSGGGPKRLGTERGIMDGLTHSRGPNPIQTNYRARRNPWISMGEKGREGGGRMYRGWLPRPLEGTLGREESPGHNGQRPVGWRVRG